MILSCIRNAALFVCIIAVTAGCGKFDHSKIKMPEFTFVTSENLHAVAYVDENHLWVCGNYGTICFSSDGGRTWQQQDSGIKDLLLGTMCFIDGKAGWAAGVKGTIVHTKDGGRTWNVQQSGTQNDLLDIYFLDERNGWAVGEFGTIVHTDDGGTTWSSQIEEQDTLFNDVFFADAATGWVVGEFGTILHTLNGGTTWQRQECRDIVPERSEYDWERPLPALYGTFFPDRDRGWIVGMDGVIITTVDGGTTWTKVNSGTDMPLYSIVVRGGKGWAVGNKGTYLMSEDAGDTWIKKTDALKTKFWLREVSLMDERHGLIVGARGTIARTDDGGTTWTLISGFRYDMEEFGLADF